MAVPGLGRGNGESVANGDRVSLWADESVLEMDGDDGYSTSRMHSMPLVCTFGNG